MEEQSNQLQTTVSRPKPMQSMPPKKKSGIGKKILGILVVLLLIAAAGFAGYTYAKNQVQKETDAEVAELQKQIDDLKASKDATARQRAKTGGSELTESLNVKDSKNTYLLKYPSSWSKKITTTKPAGAPAGWVSQQATLTSPTKAVSVRVDTGVSGIGGACLKEDAGTIKTASVTPLPSSPGYSYLQYTSGGPVKTQGLNMVYGAVVVKDSDANKAKVGSSFCDISFSSMMPMGDNVGAASFTINSASLDKLHAAGKDFTTQQINAFFASEEFKTAKEILLSLKIN